MNFQFKQYLTVKNIVMAVMAIAIIFLIVTVFKKSPEVVENSTAIEILKNQNSTLEKQLKELEQQSAAQRKWDSTLIKTYETRIYNDFKTIEQLKKKLSEKVNHINDPSFDSDSIRGAFSDL